MDVYLAVVSGRHVLGVLYLSLCFGYMHISLSLFFNLLVPLAYCLWFWAWVSAPHWVPTIPRGCTCLCCPAACMYLSLFFSLLVLWRIVSHLWRTVSHLADACHV